VTPSNKQRRAFTLIEVALAMFIVVLVIGIGLPFATGMGQQSRLREPADELKTLALTARRRAVTEQKTMEILLENHGFVLREAVIADLTSRAVIDPEKDKTEIASYPLPSGVQYSIKRWDETKFATTADARWRFLPTGLCEPITVRLSRDEDYLEFSFNPLTAQTEDESFLFR
jgi:type II secretory pathway pseudopilin PulG